MTIEDCGDCTCLEVSGGKPKYARKEALDAEMLCRSPRKPEEMNPALHADALQAKYKPCWMRSGAGRSRCNLSQLSSFDWVRTHLQKTQYRAIHIRVGILCTVAYF